MLPGSVVQADYARPLLNAFAADKGEVQIVRVSERLFPGVQERTVILLIDRAKASGGRVIYRRIANLDGLKRALLRESPRPSNRTHREAGNSRDTRLPWQLTAAEALIWDKICGDERVSQVGALLKVRIGVVTGANGFFIRSQAEIDALGKTVRSVPIISRGAWLGVVRWHGQAQVEVAQLPSRLLLFPRSESKLTVAARRELRRGEQEKIDKRSHCERRSPWYSITDTAAPELFLPYMGSQPWWLVVNEAGATCSNTIHRVWLKPEAKCAPESVAAGSWTTLFRLSAELYGRSYGGGVLKLEPSGVTNMRLPTLSASGALGDIESSFRTGGREAAQRVADQRLLVEGLGVSKRELVILKNAVARLEALRRR